MNYEQRVREIVRVALNGSERGKDWSVAGEDEATKAILSLLNQVRAEERKQVAKLMKQGLDNLPRLEQLIREAKIEQLGELEVMLPDRVYEAMLAELKAEVEL